MKSILDNNTVADECLNRGISQHDVQIFLTSGAKGAVRNRTQVKNPKTGKWVKRDADTGRFIDQKADDKPFKGVRKEKN